jgi:hypothetical protein
MLFAGCLEGLSAVVGLPATYQALLVGKQDGMLGISFK